MTLRRTQKDIRAFCDKLTFLICLRKNIALCFSAFIDTICQSLFFFVLWRLSRELTWSLKINWRVLCHITRAIKEENQRSLLWAFRKFNTTSLFDLLDLVIHLRKITQFLRAHALIYIHLFDKNIETLICRNSWKTHNFVAWK